MAAGNGSLSCVGMGMMLGAHIGPRARATIEQADVVFGAVSDPIVELWLQQMHPDVRSLQPCYAEGKSRHDTYREMVAAMLAEVRAGRRVCGAFYGHPGVFARVPHKAIAQARAEGFEAHMEAGVSAEDCLYADLGIDPGEVGCQHYEASQFMFYRRRIDPSAYLVLWQVGVAGDRSVRRSSTGRAHRRLLVERLAEDYPADHVVTLYEAATLPIMAPRMERMPMSKLVDADLQLQTTLVLPPARELQRDDAMMERIRRLDREIEAGGWPPDRASVQTQYHDQCQGNAFNDQRHPVPGSPGTQPGPGRRSVPGLSGRGRGAGGQRSREDGPARPRPCRPQQTARWPRAGHVPDQHARRWKRARGCPGRRRQGRRWHAGRGGSRFARRLTRFKRSKEHARTTSIWSHRRTVAVDGIHGVHGIGFRIGIARGGPGAEFGAGAVPRTAG